MIKIITEKINRSKGDKGRFFVTCYSCTRPLEGRNQKSSACPAPHNLYTPSRGAESLLRNAFPTIHKINKVKTGGQIQKDRPPFVSEVLKHAMVFFQSTYAMIKASRLLKTNT